MGGWEGVMSGGGRGQLQSPAANLTPPPRIWGNVSAPGARRASFVTRALPVDCCR